MSTEEGKISRKRWFAQVPDDLVTDKRLSSNAVRVWIRLDKYAGKDQDGSAMPSRGKLGADLDMSERSVSRALSELVAAGWITRRRVGQTNVWETFLNDQARATSGASGSKERATGAPETGHGRPGNGSTLARPRKDRREVDTNTSAADAADGDELDLGIDTPARTPNPVQVLVGAYVEEVKRRGGTATRARIGRVGRDVKRLLADGITEPVLLAAVVQAATRGRADIDGILAAPNGPQNAGRAERDRMFARWEEIAEQFDRRQP